MSQPLVSVLFPTYNREDHALQALTSIVEQDYEALEVIVTDNGANDVLRDYIALLGDARVQYHRNPQNLGMAGNYTRALELAQGTYVHLFSDDDVMYPGCIRRKVECFEAEPGVVFMHSLCHQIDGYGQVTRTSRWSPHFHAPFLDAHAQNARFSGDEYLRILLFRANVVTMPAVMVTREAARRAGAFRDDLDFLLDLDWWRRLLTFGDAYYVHEPLMAYRLHGQNAIYRMTPELFARENYISLHHFVRQHPAAARRLGLREAELPKVVKEWVRFMFPHLAAQPA